MNNCLVYAQGEEEWQVMWHTQNNVLSFPDPRFTFTDIPYDDTTGFIIESFGGLSRVLFYDMRPSANVQTAVLLEDDFVLYCNLMEFIPYPQIALPFQPFPLALTIAQEVYPVILDKWMQCAVEPAPTYVVLTQDDWLLTNEQMHNTQLAHQQAAYATYLAQQEAYFAAQHAEYELAMRMERERETQHLQGMLERVSLTSPNIDLKYTGSAGADDSESMEFAAPPVMQFSKPAVTSAKPNIAPESDPAVKAPANIKPSPAEVTAAQIEGFGTLLNGYPATLDKIYNFININLKPLNQADLEKFFKQVPMPFKICESLLKRKPIPEKVKRALLSKILTYPDEVYDEKVDSAISILNIANAVAKTTELHAAIETQFKNHTKRIGSKEKIKNSKKEDAEENFSIEKSKPSKPNKPAKNKDVKPTVKELSTKLFALLNSGNKIKDAELAPYESVMGMANELGQTPLMVAIKNKLSTNIISYITSSDDINILAKDEHQLSVLHYLVLYAAKEDTYRDVLQQFMIAIKELPSQGPQEQIDYFKDDGGNTFLHLLIKGNYDRKIKLKILDMFCTLSADSKLAFCLIARDQEHNNIQALLDANDKINSKDKYYDKVQDNLLMAVSQICLDLTSGLHENRIIPEDLVDYYNFTHDDNIIDTLLEDNNFTRLKEIVLFRTYIRAFLEVDCDTIFQKTFRRHDLMDEIYALVAQDTPSSLERASALIKFSRDCELSFPKSKYFNLLIGKNKLPQPNILQLVLIDLLDQRIDLPDAIKMLNFLLQVKQDDSSKLINEENYSYKSAIDYALEVIEENLKKPKSIELLQILKTNGWDIYQVNAFNQTILHRACEMIENPEIIKIFFEQLVTPETLGTILTLKDNQNRTPIQTAEEADNKEVVEFLKAQARQLIKNRLAQ